MWSRGGAHLTKPGWSKPISIPHPTNLALFGHKITLYRFNQGLILSQGAQIGAGGWVPLPSHFNHCAFAEDQRCPPTNPPVVRLIFRDARNSRNHGSHGNRDFRQTFQVHIRQINVERKLTTPDQYRALQYAGENTQRLSVKTHDNCLNEANEATKFSQLLWIPDFFYQMPWFYEILWFYTNLIFIEYKLQFTLRFLHIKSFVTTNFLLHILVFC